MLTIRLSRVGTTKRPFYRVVVIESAAPRDGRFVELLGHYDARPDPEVLQVDYARVAYWTSKGARPSDTVRTLLARHPAPQDAEASESVVAAPPDAVAGALGESGGDETPVAT